MRVASSCSCLSWEGRSAALVSRDATTVVFSDFECSYCGELAPTLDRLLAAHPDTVRLYFRHLPLPRT